MHNNTPIANPDSATTPARPAKFTMQQLRERHHFGIVELAVSATVSTPIVYYMLLNEPVPYESAVSVLKALSEQTGGTTRSIRSRCASPRLRPSRQRLGRS